MKERPILFSCPMVRAILAGKKTVTRRLVKPLHFTAADDAAMLSRCPYGVAGDRLWVRETWAPSDARFSPLGPAFLYRADGDLQPTEDGHWRPSIFMRREASRLTLEIVSVRVERLQDITEKDIVAEGVTCDVAAKMTGIPWSSLPTLHHAWQAGWDAINGKRAPWASNPWVWRVEFRKVQP